ncbi:MAG TPA: biotin--[acetyl-CoA-carboxylase] ligase, partial [Pricia sp.]|nr:biotin--[acetyl-CoA-carboxylase] ligase [Pricia sp.]
MTMQLIKLDATDSTNAYLRRLLPSVACVDYTVVWAKRQSQGRGQMGSRWQSEPGKNLTFSVLRKGLNLPANQGFVLNVCTSLAIYRALEMLQVPELSIKWPNDILSGTWKLCGILIENKISGNHINTSIIGIGLNVNQLYFNNLHKASSLRILLDRNFNLDALLHEIINQLQMLFLGLQQNGSRALWDAYGKVLFRNGMPSGFEDS